MRSATTHNPRDVLRVYVGSTVRKELRLGGPQTVNLGPGELLGFVTEGEVLLQLVVNVLSEQEHAARIEISPPISIRARLTSPSGFTSAGVMGDTLTWSSTERVLEATNVGGGAVPLQALDPRESRFAGYFWRVRVSGCDGTALAGPANRLTGDALLEELSPGQWSRLRRVSHDDLLSVEAPGKRADAPTVVAEHELFATSETAISVTEASAPGPAPAPQPGGVVPWATFTNLSVNAAGAVRTEEGWEMWTHAITGNPNVNLLIDMNGDGSLLKIGVFDVASNALLNLLTDAVTSGPTDHEYTRTWVGGGKIKIVNELAGVTPAIDLAAGWLNKVFEIADIVAQYPNAKLARAFPADNGLPADLTMPPLWLVVGDSNYARYSRVIIREVRVNG